MEKILKVDNVSKSYWNEGNEIKVLQNVSFSVNKGEIIAIMGPSGIGKSTLLNLLGTLDIPDSGNIYYNEKNPFEMKEKEIAKFRNTSIGFVFQFHHLLPEFTALENVIIPSVIYQKRTKEAFDKGRSILEKVGLLERISHRPSALSGGERQRVAVARSLINNPLVVLADEPSGNLDLENSNKLIELIIDINKEFNRTFIIATHNHSIAKKMDKVLYLDGSGAKFV